jgi:hypothetical protein
MALDSDYGFIFGLWIHWIAVMQVSVLSCRNDPFVLCRFRSRLGHHVSLRRAAAVAPLLLRQFSLTPYLLNFDSFIYSFTCACFVAFYFALPEGGVV